MELSRNRASKTIWVILFCFALLVLIGCSQEAKKERHWRRAEKYFSENKFREAIIEYKNVLQIDPNSAAARHKLGLAFLRTGQFREAFGELSKSVELDPELIDARIQLGNLYLLSRDGPKAREQAEKVLSKDPNNPSGRLKGTLRKPSRKPIKQLNRIPRESRPTSISRISMF